MKIYIDTGNIEEILAAADTGLIDGVTTNPSLIAKEGKDFTSTLKEISSILSKTGKDFTLSAEVTEQTCNAMVKQGIPLAKIDKHVIIKCPLTVEGLKATQQFTKQGIRVNVTLCFSPTQALLAAKAGAFIVSPFIGRIDDTSWDGMQLIRDIRKIYDNYGYKTQILTASVRNPIHVKEAALAGSDIATIPFKVFMQLFKHPLTDIGNEQFLKDWKAFSKKP